MLTDKQKELYRDLLEEIRNLENALLNRKVEPYMQPLVKRKIEEKKAMIRDLDRYKIR